MTAIIKRWEMSHQTGGKGMRRRKSFIAQLLTGRVLAGLVLAGINVGPVSSVEATTSSLTITLETGDYALNKDGDALTSIRMTEDFGSLGAPGEPRLPGRVYLIPLPPGAQVTDVRFEAPDAVELPGRYEIVAVGPEMTGPSDATQAQTQWEANRRRAYATDEAYPGQVGEYLGQGQWRRYTYARVAYQPFAYQPRLGTLQFHPKLGITIECQLPEPDSLAWREVERLRGDGVLDDIIAHNLLNFDQAQAWYPTATANSLYDYVIVVEDETMAAAVTAFKTWKV